MPKRSRLQKNGSVGSLKNNRLKIVQSMMLVDAGVTSSSVDGTYEFGSPDYYATFSATGRVGDWKITVDENKTGLKSGLVTSVIASKLDRDPDVLAKQGLV